MKTFNKSWMEKCNPDLILRFWRYKGSPGTLTIRKYGIYMAYTRTLFGDLVRLLPRIDIRLEKE